MTRFALNRYSGRGVIWCLGGRIFCLMTTLTFNRSSGITGGMTTCTINRDMCSGQWKIRCRMVKCGLKPVRRIVTHGTIGRKLGSHMVFGSIVLNLMTRITIRLGRSGIAFVTSRALYNGSV